MDRKLDYLADWNEDWNVHTVYVCPGIGRHAVPRTRFHAGRGRREVTPAQVEELVAHAMARAAPPESTAAADAPADARPGTAAAVANDARGAADEGPPPPTEAEAWRARMAALWKAETVQIRERQGTFGRGGGGGTAFITTATANALGIS